MQQYTYVAQFYDYLMRHVDYVTWGEYIGTFTSLVQCKSKLPIQNSAAFSDGKILTVLELACGTGKMQLELAKAGHHIFGMDYSTEMLQISAKRLRQTGYSPHLWCGDMRHLRTKIKFNIAICLYDSINYCLKLEEVQQVLNNVSTILTTGGLFIFDVCTLHNCRKNFGNYTENDAKGHISYQRYSHFEPGANIQHNEFCIFNEDIAKVEFHENHIQKIYSLKQIRSTINKRYWKEVGCFSGFSRHPGTERSERVHFVLQKK